MFATRSTFGLGSKTATAGTAIVRMIPPRSGGTKKLRTVITTIEYTTSTTAHTISLIRPFANTTVVSAAASGQKVVVLTVDPGLFPKGPSGSTSLVATAATAASDYLVFETPCGAFYFDKVASVAAGTVAGNINATMTSNLPTNGIAAGARVWLMKAAGGNDPFTGLVNETLTTTASTSNQLWQEIQDGIFSSGGFYEPILVSVDNATAAGTLVRLCGAYVQLP